MPACAFFYFFSHGDCHHKCLSCDKAHYVPLVQAVDLVLQDREDHLVIQDEKKEDMCVTLYVRKDLGGPRDYYLEITHHMGEGFAAKMEEIGTYFVKIGCRDGGYEPYKSRKVGERRVKR